MCGGHTKGSSFHPHEMVTQAQWTQLTSGGDVQSPPIPLASLVTALSSLTFGSVICYLILPSCNRHVYACAGSHVLFLLLPSFVLMSAPCGLDRMTLNPSGRVEPALPESGRTG